MTPVARDSIGGMERVARAYSLAVPERPADDGLFGPRSVVWRMHRDRCLPLLVIRSLVIEALHPLAMAGVAQHSEWRRDPTARLASTTGYMLTITFGERAAVQAAAARVRAIHERVHGVDDVTGRPYRADDPALLLWIHACSVESTLAVVGRYGRPFTADEADRYVAEMARAAEIVGVPAGMAPATVGELTAYMESVPLLQATPAARETSAYVLDPPDLDDDLRDTWRELGQAAIGSLPVWARELYGYPMPEPEAMERETVRQLLGVLDLTFESLPGVLEARERIELRMRA